MSNADAEQYPLLCKSGWTSAKAKLEPEWNSFEAEVRKYVESFGKQIEQQRATFKLQSAAQLKAWREAADKLAGDTRQFTTERQAEIDAAVKRMQADAAAAEVKLLKQMGTQSWSALMAVLTETRTAFDRAARRSSELPDPDTSRSERPPGGDFSFRRMQRLKTAAEQLR